MIERNDVTAESIPNHLGHSVLKDKAILSYDCGNDFADNPGMPERMSETEETALFIGRVREAREAKFATQKPVYKFLEVEQDQYKHWETKRPMPRRYIPKFCIITEVSMEWLLTGEGKGPVKVDIPKSVPRRMGKAAKGKAA